MRCPYCKHPAQAAVPECERCGMSFEKVGRLFGALPHVKNGLNDRAILLSRSRRSKIERQLRDIETKFPQVHVTVLIVPDMDAKTPLAPYAFWIFNSPGVCRGLEKGAMNHAILLTVDAENRRANLIVGYGLEPYLGESHLHEALSAGREAFAEDDLGGGIDGVLKGITMQLHHLVQTFDSEQEAPASRPQKVYSKVPAY